MFREHLGCFDPNNVDMARNMEENVRKLKVSVVKEFTANRFQDSQGLESLTKLPRVRSNVDNFNKYRIVSKLSFECSFCMRYMYQIMRNLQDKQFSNKCVRR